MGRFHAWELERETGFRTRDILLGKQTLCQLSYSRSAGRFYRRSLAWSAESQQVPSRRLRGAVRPGLRPWKFRALTWRNEGGESAAVVGSASCAFSDRRPDRRCFRSWHRRRGRRVRAGRHWPLAARPRSRMVARSHRANRQVTATTIPRGHPPFRGAGIAWFAGNFAGTLVFVHRAVLAHAVLTLPNGKITSVHVAAVVAAGYVGWLLFGATNSLPILIVMTLILPATAALDWLRAPARARRPRLIALSAAVLLSGAYLVAAIVHVAVPSGRLGLARSARGRSGHSPCCSRRPLRLAPARCRCRPTFGNGGRVARARNGRRSGGAVPCAERPVT